MVDRSRHCLLSAGIRGIRVTTYAMQPPTMARHCWYEWISCWPDGPDRRGPPRRRYIHAPQLFQRRRYGCRLVLGARPSQRDLSAVVMETEVLRRGQDPAVG